MKYIALSLAACLLCGCASVRVYPVKNDHGSVGKELRADDSGVRFYRPALYVWITKAPVSETKGKGADAAEAPYSGKVVVLPDFRQEYVVQWKSGTGSVNPNFTLTDGWNLTAFNSSADSKLSEMVGSLGTLAAAFVGEFTREDDVAGLYRLNVDKEGNLSLGDRVLSLPPKK